MKKKLWRPVFGANITPACEYCGRGRPTASGETILCPKRGVVVPYYSCRKFFYSPLKRVPKRLPALPSYSEEEFKL